MRTEERSIEDDGSYESWRLPSRLKSGETAS